MDRVFYLHEVFFLDCPYCGPDNTAWVDGTYHPAEAGVEHVSDKWEVAFAQMLGSCANRSR
jgi:hypothetical protein